jgi:hypothetical protein
MMTDICVHDGEPNMDMAAIEVWFALQSCHLSLQIACQLTLIMESSP